MFGTQRSALCIECTIAKAQQQTQPLPKNHRTHQRRQLEKSYGLPPGRYEHMLEEQKHCCAICQRHEDILPANRFTQRRLAIDHSHTTGQVRGLLCTSCNWALGRFQDSIPTLRRAIQYLRAHPDLPQDAKDQLSMFQQESVPAIFVPEYQTGTTLKPTKQTKPPKPKKPANSIPKPVQPKPTLRELAYQTLREIKNRQKLEKKMLLEGSQ
jgi:hypothetical protein